MAALAPMLQISMTDADDKFHVDSKKGLARRFPPNFPLPLHSLKGTWQIDAVAEHAPWLVRVEPHQAIIDLRLAVHCAHQVATAVIGQKRSQFEARTILKKGYLDKRGDIIRLLRIAASKPKQPLNFSERTALLWAESLVERLRLKSPPAIAEDGTCGEMAAWLETIGSAVSSGAGRASTFDLNSFFQYLVGFWDRKMSIRAPRSRRRDAASRRHRVAFHDFATAAASDAGCENTAALERAISRAVVAIRCRKR
jgi:hypothetical protein